MLKVPLIQTNCLYVGIMPSVSPRRQPFCAVGTERFFAARVSENTLIAGQDRADPIFGCNTWRLCGVGCRLYAESVTHAVQL